MERERNREGEIEKERERVREGERREKKFKRYGKRKKIAVTQLIRDVDCINHKAT